VQKQHALVNATLDVYEPTPTETAMFRIICSSTFLMAGLAAIVFSWILPVELSYSFILAAIGFVFALVSWKIEPTTFSEFGSAMSKRTDKENLSNGTKSDI
jgi:hypothetical protein